ncbi:MAG: patatin-like phospholipase family protein [Filomicrobium sp.]
MDQNPPETKAVNLALQGGGAHGAFTWGVLDRLLECPVLSFDAVTGASAGAMNAVALADGLADGCRTEARERLAAFWGQIAKLAQSSPFQPTLWDSAMGNWNLNQSPMFLWYQMVSQVVSPYDTNPFNYNPLLESICKLIDFDRVRRSPVGVYITATNVHTGRGRVFEAAELTAKHVMASACLPQLYKAVEIDGVPYWDGGFMGNPPLWPLFENAPSSDVIIVQINPFSREETPKSAQDISDRLNEITFNASLVRELRAVDFVARLIASGRLDGTGYRNIRIHVVEDEEFLSTLGASSKLNASASFFELLFEKGRAAADGWLNENLADIGKRSTIDLAGLFGREHDALDGERITRKARVHSDQ